MLDLCVNTYVDAIDEEKYKFHRSKASTMDLGDMTIHRTNFNMPFLETNDDKHVPSVNVAAIV